MHKPLVIGLDFDNTIVCYDELFPRVAVEDGLVPEDLPRTKGQIRDYLRQVDREDDWTRLQGCVYGAHMAEAKMFPGVMDFLSACRNWAITVCIISHKTKKPYLGPDYDLHQAAREWIENNGFYDPECTNLTRDHVFFELTKEAKLQRIAEVGCTLLVDDLPEFLAESDFPAGVERILFDPSDAHTDHSKFERVNSWAGLRELINRKRPDAE